MDKIMSDFKTCISCISGPMPSGAMCRDECIPRSLLNWRERVPVASQAAAENRVDVIGQNGNDGAHYDSVYSPSHYTQGPIECIDAIKSALTAEEYKGYCKGNIIKYVWREKHKGGVESLEKSRWYLDRLLPL
jgi:hypothetical protein